MSGWVLPAIQIGATIWGGLTSSKMSSANASMGQAIAYGNAQSARAQGRQQALFSVMSAKFNANLMLAQAQAQNDARKHIAMYNSQLLEQVANYNSLLYNEEINGLMNALDLDIHTLEVMSAKARGTVSAMQGASGVLMNQDSNADVLIQMKTDEELDKLVLKTNADIKTKALLNASAQGQWQAKMEGRKMLYESQVSGQADMLTASLQARGTVFSGLMEAMSVSQSMENRAWSIASEGAQRATNERSQAAYYKTRAFVDSAGPLYELLS